MLLATARTTGRGTSSCGRPGDDFRNWAKTRSYSPVGRVRVRSFWATVLRDETPGPDRLAGEPGAGDGVDISAIFGISIATNALLITIAQQGPHLLGRQLRR